MLGRRQKIIGCCVLAMGAYLMLKLEQEKRKERKRHIRSIAAHNRKRLLNRKRAAANVVNAKLSSNEASPSPKKLSTGRPSEISPKQPTTKLMESENVEEPDVLAEAELKIEDHQAEEQDPFADAETEIKVEIEDDKPHIEEELEAFEGDISESQDTEEEIHKVKGMKPAVRKVLTTAGAKNRLKNAAAESTKLDMTDSGD